MAMTNHENPEFSANDAEQQIEETAVSSLFDGRNRGLCFPVSRESKYPAYQPLQRSFRPAPCRADEGYYMRISNACIRSGCNFV
jgi:hypothetical protein